MAANTISALRTTQWGFEATSATGTLTLGAQPSADDEITVGSTTYTYVASGASSAGQINIGQDLPEAKTNTLAAINGTDGWNDPNPLVTAGEFSTDDSAITAKVPGPAGNDIVLTATFDSGSNSVSGSGKLTGGAHARGTPVAATSKIAVENFEFSDDDNNLYQPKFQDRGLVANFGRPVPVQRGTRWSFPDQPVVWEQLVHWLSLAVKGDVQPTVESGPPEVYKWVFERDPYTDPQAYSVTLERRFSNGAGGTIEERASYAMLSQYTIKFALNDTLKHSGNGFARKAETNSITAALTMPSPNLGVSALSSVHIDDDWASVGNTLVSNTVIGWEMVFQTGYFPRYTADERDDLDFTLHQLNGDEVLITCNLQMLVDPSFYASESAHAEAGDIRAVQIKMDGSGGRLATLDFMGYHSRPGMPHAISMDNGQDIVDLSLVSTHDGANFFRATVEHPTVDSIE